MERDNLRLLSIDEKLQELLKAAIDLGVDVKEVSQSNAIDIKLVLQILELVSVYGLPAVQSIVSTWQKDSVTIEDVELLRRRLKRPTNIDTGSKIVVFMQKSERTCFIRGTCFVRSFSLEVLTYEEGSYFRCAEFLLRGIFAL